MQMNSPESQALSDHLFLDVISWQLAVYFITAIELEIAQKS